MLSFAYLLSLVASALVAFIVSFFAFKKLLVKANKAVFKTCSNTFYERFRKYTEMISSILSIVKTHARFSVKPASLKVNCTQKEILDNIIRTSEATEDGKISDTFSTVYFEIIRSADLLVLSVEIDLYTIGIVRVNINEKYDEKQAIGKQKRFKIPQGDVIDEEVLRKMRASDVIVKQNMEETIITSFYYTYNDFTMQTFDTFNEGKNYCDKQELQHKEKHNFNLHIKHIPFSLHVNLDEECILQMNTKQLLNWERLGKKKGDFMQLTPDEKQALGYLKAKTSELEEKNFKAERILNENYVDTQKNGQKKCFNNSSKEKSRKILEGILLKVRDAVDIHHLNAWEEKFNEFVDCKKHGPNAVGLDFTFPNSIHAYGAPEHSSSFSLIEHNEPYRFFNLDVFQYSLDSPSSLYGSIPLIHFVHSNKKKKNEKSNFSFFWLNPSETWMTLHKNKDEICTNWLSECGSIEFFVFMGPKHYNTFTQYHLSTGFPSMPPIFALAKHQCRWNYNEEKDVKNLDKNFDLYNIPCDVIWLDIEHTNNKKYFTWDLEKFPHPKKLLNYLDKKHRKLVTIVDPHIKKEDGYYVYDEAKENNFLIKNSKNEIFYGLCWSKKSVYPDFLNPQVREWWKMLHSYDKYEGSASNLFIWNDMNEPSVFNGPELTMPKNNIHYNGIEHREVHNLYGLYLSRSTYEGLLKRGEHECNGFGRRPFVLSRSFFASSHRYGFVWTGDNASKWEYLSVSIPMILSNSIAGMSACGADVGGFLGNPDKELITRWHQLGIWYPFYREHAHIDSAYREPWMWDATIIGYIRDAVITRYKLLPYWYTLFAEYALKGCPIIRPLWWISIYDKDQSLEEREEDKDIYKRDDAYLVGNEFYVKVIDKPLSELNKIYHGYTEFYLPKTLYGWYDYYTGEYYTEYGNVLSHTKVTLKTIPVFVSAASIFATKEIIRSTSYLMKFDPYTLNIYLSNDNQLMLQKASGRIYVDDEESFAYKKGKFVYQSFLFYKNTLSTKKIPIQNINEHSQHCIWGDYIPSNNEIDKIIIWSSSDIPHEIYRCKGSFFKEKTKLNFLVSEINNKIITKNNYFDKKKKLSEHIDVIEKCQSFKKLYKIEIEKPDIHIGIYDWTIIFK